MNYRPTWELDTIPPDSFWREVARRRAMFRPLKKTSANERARLDRQREAVRKYRAKLKNT